MGLCSSDVSDSGTEGSYGFKSVVKGSIEDIEIPENYFCAVDYTAKQYSSMKLTQVVGTGEYADPMFSVFKLNYQHGSDTDVFLYQSWSQLKSSEGGNPFERTLTKEGVFYSGSEEFETTQSALYWSRRKGQKLSECSDFKISFAETTKKLFLANAPNFFPMWLFIGGCIIALPLTIYCMCKPLTPLDKALRAAQIPIYEYRDG